MDLRERLQKFIDAQGITNQQFEKKVGLSNGAVSKMSDNSRSSTLDLISKAYPQLNMVWLRVGEGEMLNTANSTLQNVEMHAAKEDESGIPLIPINAMAGFLCGDAVSFMNYECEHYVVPAFRGADFLIRVQGDSMIPKYMPGDLLACKKVVMDKLWFQWGKCYVADTYQGALVKRVEPSQTEGCIEMDSENPAYKPFDLPLSEVNGLAMVVGVLRVE